MSRPRAVMIAPVLPARTGLGLAMRMGVTLEALCRTADVELIVLPIAGRDNDPGARRFITELGAYLRIIPVAGRQETHFALLSRLSAPAARLDAFRAYGRPSLASALSAPVLAEIRSALEATRPGLVHIGRAYLAPVVDAAPPRSRVCLDFDEDDAASFRSQAAVARAAGRPDEADWLEEEALAFMRLIEAYAGRAGRTFVASVEEARRLACRHAGLRPRVIRNAVQIPRLRPEARPANGNVLLFVGALGYAPNAEGVAWFARAVLPRIAAQRPGPVRLLIAGASAPPAVAALARHPGVDLLGFVPDLAPLYARATLALAPLHSGGGTRIKLLEAAAHRVATVATEISARGLEWRAPVGGWRADSAAGFASACCEALADPAERHRRAALASARVRRHHARDQIVSELADAFADALGTDGV